MLIVSQSARNDREGSSNVNAKPYRTTGRYFRTPLSALLAVAGGGLLTFGLLILMMSLITDEFAPQDVMEFAAFEINVQPEEVALIEDRSVLPLQKAIEVPPAPPAVEVLATAKPSVPIVRMSEPDMSFTPDILMPTTVAIIADRDPSPLVRIPPVMPPRADRSGHCRVAFDIGTDGRPFNVRAVSCSQGLFERPAVKSVQKWTYRSEMRDGRPVIRQDLETLIRFQLQDDRGQIIPE